MSAISVTAAKVGRVNAMHDRVKTYKAAVSITAGQATYLTSSGTLGLASAAAAATAQVRGIALNAAAAGEACTVISEGEVSGFTLSGNYDTLVYLSNTAGGLDTGAGTVTVRVGRVAPMNDISLTKVLSLSTQVTDAWS